MITNEKSFDVIGVVSEEIVHLNIVDTAIAKDDCLIKLVHMLRLWLKILSFIVVIKLRSCLSRSTAAVM
jgi:hypothetical protein